MIINNKMNSEKNTDHLMLSLFNDVFNVEYNTKSIPELFGRLIPDGWLEYTNFNNQKYLFIIENKQNVSLFSDGIKQLIKYYYSINFNKRKEYAEIYLILGVGNNRINFKYYIFTFKNNKLNKLNKTLEDIKSEMNYRTDFNDKDIHDFNQYMWDHGINLTKSQKTLFVASILLSLKIDPNFINNYTGNEPGFIIADKMLSLINEGYNDPIFTNQFNFLKKSIKNKYLYDLIQKIYIDLRTYGSDILNKFYSEFCKYDKNNDSSLGVVLTPHDIIEIMINELHINHDNLLLDFCTGTGSFLLEGSKYTSHLIGCEYNEERYALAKCNFILNDLDYSKLYYNSCFSINFDKVDCSIINPPFSTNSSDLNLVENETKWQNYNNEQKFLLYQVQCLKIGGLGACIIPRSNFNNTIKKTTEFKAELMKHVIINKIINCNSKIFAPVANVECAIIIYTRVKSTDNPQVSKNVTIIDYTDDGYKIKNKIRVKISEPSINEQTRDLDYKSDFNYQISIIDNYPDIKKLLLLDKINHKYYELINMINNINDDVGLKDNIMKIKLSDILEPLKLKTYSNRDNGKYPLFGATKINKLSGYSDDYSIDTYKSDDISIKINGLCCINKTGNGGAGYLHIHKGKFAITSSVLPCKIKINLSDINYSLISVQLHKIFDRYNGFTLNHLDTEVFILIDEAKLNIPDLRIDTTDIDDICIKRWDKLKIGDYFDIPKIIQVKSKSTHNTGIYPLVGAGSKNNGIIKYIDHYDYDGRYITVARTGSTGVSFCQNGKFSIDTAVKIIKPKSDSTDCHIWAMMLNYYLPQKYSYSATITNTKLLNEIIPIPVFKKNE